MTDETQGPVRWSLNQAAGEFGFARQTVKNRLVAAGISPGEDSRYSTADLLRALYGDLDGEKLRKLRAEASLAELELARAEKSVLDVGIVARVWADELGNLRGAVLNCTSISKVDRHQLLKALHDLPLAAYSEDPGTLAEGEE